jgi:hypothetical protein
MYIKCDYCKISLLSEHAWKRFFSDNHSLFDLHTISLIYFTTIQCADLFFIFLFFYFWCFNATFNNISAMSMATSFSGEGNRSTRRELYQLRLRVECTLFSSPGQRPCELSVLPSLGVRRPSHLNLLLRNHWANCNQHYSMGYCKLKIYNLGGSQGLSFVYLLLLNLLILLIHSGLLTISLF